MTDRPTRTRVRYKFTKSPLYRDIHIDGIWGGVHPGGYIQLASATAGSSDTRWHASRSTGSTSSLRKAEPVMPVEGLEDRFLRLSNEWKRDTGHLSLVSQIAAHPSYKGIVAMGEPAIPLILRDLQTEPDHWFSALSAIASGGPEIPVHERGNIRAVSEAWVKWGKTKKYID